ncbi:non-heme chloroperoxidase [Variibacter gotjawalensis]|uniref:Non-heme chloroperoxidase n=1 Tax=Variibacter gotjawalensis TaxID=1333996 RepID=A0A0S3PXQ3_9BRAD|nr:alpha/beta hydrolase [Variibacter gotjawalensis]NIK46548.1 pimeloyl-ACP methyl ester carboxylesterase [Variibacter gotjawalensis]RZS48453.1 pimeloyl-ACP methyl ester carboxylesterase [Variibacter gotjawalensis]BAT60714.1 non-heme chloroperoxidase [Variibacter gotjawalensis]
MATFVVAHGAWSAGWAWKKMHPRMRAAGHELVTPSYTGMGERNHLANPNVDLDTHITDVVNVLEYHDLKDVVLLGHSYGGMTSTGIADRARERVAKLVYLDAFAPQDGQSAFDMMPTERAAGMRERADKEGEGWRLPVNPMPPDTAEDDKAWAMPRRMPQPIKTFSTPLRLLNGPLTLPRYYIYCKQCMPGDGFRPSYERARHEGWGTFEIDATHNPHITAPDALMKILQTIAG